MANKDFDNLVKILKVRTAPTDTTLVSTEVDFELPRGFIAKVNKIHWTAFINATIIGVDAIQIFSAVLLRDPDDVATIVIPSNVVQHDAISDFNGMWVLDFTTSGAPTFQTQRKVDDFREDLDVITARNMRLNVQSSLTTMDVTYECVIYYTLEEVNDADILNLLDIL